MDPDEDEDELQFDGDSGTDDHMMWPQATLYIVFFLCVAMMWHDCFGRH